MIGSIDFACNDPDNGLFDGRVQSAMYGDIEIELPWIDGVRFTELDGAIRIHRRKFPIVDTCSWVGNWCWNRYFLRRADLKRLLFTLRAERWRVTCGPHRFYDWWNGRDA